MTQNPESCFGTPGKCMAKSDSHQNSAVFPSGRKSVMIDTISKKEESPVKILMVNGSPHPKGCTARALEEMEAVFHAAAMETETICLGTEVVRGCAACGVCKTTGRCVFGGAVNTFLDKAETADAVVFGSPVHFASLSGTMTSFLDRVFFAGSEQLANKPAACLVSSRRAGTTAALDQLLKYPMYANMPIVASRYWPMVHGNRAEDVEQDLEGLQIMRQMARNLVWMLRCIEAGKNAGVPLPEHEAERIATNYIR